MVITDEARSLLASGHEFLARGECQRARTAFEAARDLVETPEALEGLGLAAWWLDDAETVFEARERAYRLYRRRSDRHGAARVAMMIALDSLHFRGQMTVARGWHRRAHSLLEGLPPLPDHAWLRLWDCEISLAAGDDVARVRTLAAEALAMGRALDDADVEMFALSMEGLALVSQGVVAEGMGRLDEAATAALSGDMTNPLAIGITCCHLVTACELVCDFGRAAEWCERVREFAARVNFNVLLSVCRTQHAGVLMWGGAWSEAEAELDRAIRHLARARPSMQEQPLVRLAELRRRQGRFDEALALLEKVEWHPHGRLVRAAIALDRGDPAAATDLARRFLEQLPPSNKIDRARAGELLLQAELALGQTPGPRKLEDMHSLANGIGTDPFRASTRAMEGRIAAASGQYERARVALEEAISLFARAGASYETARARVELARSLIALDRDDAARDELERACRVFEGLGAAWDARGARDLIETVCARRGAPAGPANRGGLSARELEVLRLMTKGLKNPEIGEQLGVSPFTVKRHVANILTKLDLPTRAAAAAYAAREGWA